MSVTFQFDLVTPEKRLVSQEEMMLTVPGAEGYFGVLPGHAPLVSLLSVGVLTMGEGRQAVRYAVAGGYAEILPDRATILADRAVCWDSIDPVAVEKEKSEAATQEAATREDESASRYWQKQRAFAAVCLEVHKRYLERDSA
ncbi:MAG: ATP synthase F1 subunit epsilon [Magnetococcales bacterium]|nr:ATP synthase F1 subunit epsilon [Magnetococcales bacterium]